MCIVIAGKDKVTVFLWICLSVAVLGLCCCAGFSVVAVSGGCSVAAAHSLLTVVASLVVGHGLKGIWTSAVVVPGL